MALDLLGRTQLTHRRLGGRSCPGLVGRNVVQHRRGQLGRGQAEPNTVDNESKNTQPGGSLHTDDPGQQPDADDLEGQPEDHHPGGTHPRG